MPASSSEPPNPAAGLALPGSTHLISEQDRILGKHVTFKPYEITVEVPDGENLLRAALLAGVHINASCGGEGVCGKCKVLLESGELDEHPLRAA